MTDRTAARIGFVLAGIGFVTAIGGLFPDPPLAWPAGQALIASGVALVAVIAFGTRRYGLLDRQTAAPLAATGGIALAGYAGYAVVSQTGQLSGPVVTAIAGSASVIAAYADWAGFSRERLTQLGVAATSAALIGVSGLIAIFIWAGAILSIVEATGQTLGAETATILSTVALGLGTASVAVIYLQVSDRDLDFIDWKWPDGRDIWYAIGGSVAIIALNLAIGAVFDRLGFESTSHSLIQTAESEPGILLVLIPLAYLVVGPGEELLYRNIVQKSLYSQFSRNHAIIVASLIFAGVHFFAFNTGGRLLAVLNTLAIVFTLSLVLGIVYERTDNVVVAAFVHGTFDAVAFAVTYIQITETLGMAVLT